VEELKAEGADSTSSTGRSRPVTRRAVARWRSAARPWPMLGPVWLCGGGRRIPCRPRGDEARPAV